MIGIARVTHAMQGISLCWITAIGVSTARQAPTVLLVPAAAPPALRATTPPISAWAIAIHVVRARTAWQGPVSALHALMDITSRILALTPAFNAVYAALGPAPRLAAVRGRATPFASLSGVLLASTVVVERALAALLERTALLVPLTAYPARAGPTLDLPWVSAANAVLARTVSRAPAAALPVRLDPTVWQALEAASSVGSAWLATIGLDVVVVVGVCVWGVLI